MHPIRTVRAVRTFAVVALLGASAVSQAPAAKPQEPAKKPAPQALALGMTIDAKVALKDIDGVEHKASDYRGKIVVVNFFSTECPVQNGWDPQLAAIEREFAKKGVVFLNIDSNRSEIGDEPQKPAGDAKPYADIRQHLAEKKLPYTMLVDHGNVVADLFGARTTPDIFVFSAEGKLTYRGLIAETAKGEPKQHLRDTLGKLLAGEKVEPFQTTPQGCGIKRVPKAKAKDPAGEGKERSK